MRHAATNFSFTLIHLILHTGFAVVIVVLADWCRRNGFGLTTFFPSPVWLTLIISALVLDFFAGWLVHITEHKLAWMWRFHVIHHADNNVDVTTGLRHHPVESIFRGVFMLIGVLVAGAPMYAVMIYQTLLVLATQFTHANIRLPRWLDGPMSLILVSPNMHKVHHHWQQPYTDSNYGALFSIWDRLFHTFSKLDPSKIRYGLDRYYPNEKDENLPELLKSPFKKQDFPGV